MTETATVSDGLISSSTQSNSPLPSLEQSTSNKISCNVGGNIEEFDREIMNTDDNDGSDYQDAVAEETERNSIGKESTDVAQSSHNNRPLFKFGPYVPILRKDDKIIIDPNGVIDHLQSDQSPRKVCHVLPDDSIVEAPSLVTPLLLKKKTVWPPRNLVGELSNATDEDVAAQIGGERVDSLQSSDDIEVIKVVTSSSSNNNDSKPDSCRADNYNGLGHPERSTEYIRAATIASLTHTKSKGNINMIPAINDYYKSSVGVFLQGIGLSRVTEFCLDDTAKRLARRTKKLEKRNQSTDHIINDLKSIQSKLTRAEANNKAFKSKQLLRCSRCRFKSEFSLVMNGHLEVPHKVKRDYICNWCEYRTNETSKILFHSFIEHKQRCRTEKPPFIHQCQYCPFECRNKAKLQTHISRCEGIFSHNTFLGPQDYGAGDFPTITAKFITQQDIKSYEETLKTLRLAAYNPNYIRVAGFEQPIRIVSKQQGRSSKALNQLAGMSTPSVKTPIGAAMNGARNSYQTGDQRHSSQLMNLLATQNNYPNQPRASIVQYPKTQSSLMNVRSVMQTATEFVIPPTNPSNINHNLNATDDYIGLGSIFSQANDKQSPHLSQRMDSKSSSSSLTPNSKGSTFVICEICDGYIKDLSQLKSHMQWIHKVKIHQKMLLSRPPLNCQKCQWRFFTDQGLERHLLGAHGLVTSNMQEQVDQGTDSGRCTVCGRAYANKLVAHMREVHKSLLKPAHLSYKCTVCAATFNLYRLFENHVYSVHTESVRQVSSN